MLLLKRRNIVIISTLILTFITFIFCLTSIKGSSELSLEQPKIKIVLDAGHGGVDGGVSGVSTGVKESQLNLAIVKKLEKYLIDAGFSVVLTRSTDAGLYGIATKNLKKKDMQKRREIILNAEPSVVVSVHLNKYSLSSRRGAQIFYREDSENGKLLANCIQTVFNEMPESKRNLSPLKGDYFLLNCSDYPSVIAECGFLSNPEEEALLVTEEYQDSVAYTLFKGIVSYLVETSVNEE